MKNRGLTRREALGAGAGLLLSACAPWKSNTRPEHFEKPPNVVVFLSDALRADHLGCYGYPLRTSPHLDRFANQSLLFERCYSAASWTKPACASLFTSTLPPVHKMMLGEWCDTRRYTLHTGLDTLDMSFATGGYDTAWFLSNPLSRRELGFGRGFAHYSFEAEMEPNAQVNAIVTWLKEQAAEPFFLFIHMIDPHDPYVVDEAEYEAFAQRPIKAALAELPPDERDTFHDFHQLNWAQRLKTTGRLPLQKFSPAAIAYASSLYDTEIRRVDKLFHRLCQTLREQQQFDDTLMVVTADHAHAFNEHGFCYHGNSVYNDELHIPFIMKLPGSEEGRRFPEPCSQCDIAPTLLALAGQDPLPRAQGRPLVYANGDSRARAPIPVFAYHSMCHRNRTYWEMAIFHGREKLVHMPDREQTALFDIFEDPREQHDLLSDPNHEGPAQDELVQMAQRLKGEHFSAALDLGMPEWFTEVPDGHTEALQALGYL